MSATLLPPDYSARLVPALQRVQHEFGYLKREGLEQAARELAVPPYRPHGVADFVINPYCQKVSDYASVLQAISVRDTALAAAAQILESRFGWSPVRIEQFRRAALGRLSADACPDAEVGEAVTAWGTDRDWAQGPTLGGWSETLLQELKDGDLRGMGGAGI